MLLYLEVKEGSILKPRKLALFYIEYITNEMFETIFHFNYIFGIVCVEVKGTKRYWYIQ